MGATQRNDQAEGWQARCVCGWSGTRDEGFVHQREHRVTVTFRNPLPLLPEALRPPRAVSEALAPAQCVTQQATRQKEHDHDDTRSL